MSCSITYTDVHYRYADGTHALRGISFELQHGEHVALLGPNGAGKSTLMLLANGILMPNSGSVQIGQLQLTSANLPAIRKRVGLLFQDPDDQLFMTSVFDDVAFGPLNLGWPADRVQAEVQQALEAVGLYELRQKAPQDLSFGQKKRAALATVLSMQPDFLILDEPSSNLDPQGRREMIDLLQKLKQTVLIATHDLDLVWDLLPRSIVIDEGQVVASGPTRELLSNQQLLEAHRLELPGALRYGSGQGECPSR
ncbi:MAG: energy-coupling factor ABC transporter ATP-binding protein [Coriobacteriia bacterium]|nr:energy-coupling factor ABC transporter ATP-binding protein [Coriobacteriia bacterium]